MAGGGVLQVTPLVTIVLCYLMAITSDSHLARNGLFEYNRKVQFLMTKIVDNVKQKRKLKKMDHSK